MARVGGQVPDSYGLSLTVTVPAASDASPVEAGDILNFTATGPYHAALAADGGAVQLIAKHPVTDPLTPLGVWVLGFSRVQKMNFSGAAPAIGSSVVADGAGGVRADATANGSRVLYVDAARGYVEVALP
ncbi:hypothetical protein OCO53_25360 [Peribacillus frigoritolerans]|uniref:hypothetical protein n=1 Tax=Peribacillus frigoritolerans TaxID=450367 RepID=UPI0021CF8E7F|nr:hypothetical protein [Peribacillus frigoritolerans]MCU6603772.1 hypothetical protein [Peribacillus frigoritolerans]